MEEEFSVGSPSYYSVLGVSQDSSNEEIRRAYRKLAMQWHPDKWARSPSLLGKAKKKFQQIQEAYSVLSDRNKRIIYDSGLYDFDEEVEEGFTDFLQEMVSLMDNVKKEGKIYTMDELQGMFEDMRKCFEETTQWSSYTHEFTFGSSQCYPQPFASSINSPKSMNWLNGGVDSSGNLAKTPYSNGHNMGFTSLSAENGLDKTFQAFWR